MTKDHTSQGKSLTLHIDTGIVSGGKLESLQSVYPLTEADFLRLKMKESKLKTVSGFIFAGVVGYIFNISEKIFDLILHKNFQAVQNFEWAIILIGLLLGFLVFLLGDHISNERSKTMNDIEKYFNNTKKNK